MWTVHYLFPIEQFEIVSATRSRFSLFNPSSCHSSPVLIGKGVVHRISSRRSPPPHPFTFTPRWKSRCGWARATQSGRIQTLSDAVVVVDDEKYGKKQVISITPQLYRYILDNVREPAILKELREETAALHGSQMQVSPDQAQLLAMLVQILGAQRCIEVGIYTGYSSLAIALVLPESGRLVACERDEQCLRVADKYYERAGVSHKVAVKRALAVDSLESMIKEGEAGRSLLEMECLYVASCNSSNATNTISCTLFVPLHAVISAPPGER